MALTKIGDLYPDYKEDIFGGDDIKNYSVYSEQEEKIGTVDDILVDESGSFRYFVIDTGFWIFGKKVLLPVGRAHIDYNQHRLYALGMTREQVESLPEYREDMTIDYDYEERVRNVYRPGVAGTTGATTASTYDRDTYSYDRDRPLYNLDEQNHQKFKLYQERLVANKDRFRIGTVTVGKHVETETARVSVPVEKERVVIERTDPTSTTPVTPGSADFREGEVARMEVYEETADIDKQAFVREEVNIKKEVQRDTVDATEQVRREELDVDVDNESIVDRDRVNRDRINRNQ
ncbi:DUF2382 domain-containing protein [Pleurocapsales cyanobacterium LEGE 06147]|nr:DUF2382 domain-containing protein [Pleurocapsales cyanobacterium LEGE 06147]